MTSKELDKKATRLGTDLARKLFDARAKGGRRNVEVHLTEAELAAWIAMGALAAWSVRPEFIKDPEEG